MAGCNLIDKPVGPLFLQMSSTVQEVVTVKMVWVGQSWISSGGIDEFHQSWQGRVALGLHNSVFGVEVHSKVDRGE